MALERVSLRGLSLGSGGGWSRETTVVELSGGGCLGEGEDVNYSVPEQQAFRVRVESFQMEGRGTLAEWSERFGSLPLFVDEPDQAASRDYRRWAFESAALDLALQQAGESLADRWGRSASPLRFVHSMGLKGGSAGPLEAWAAAHPSLEFKVDAHRNWDAELVERLAATGAVRVVDLKGAYGGDWVEMDATPEAYGRIVEGLPGVFIEDPEWNETTAPVLEPHRERITWDAPIHGVADVLALPFEPRVLNFKPSRCGRLEALFDLYDHCADRGIELYGGGQFELGVGRTQAQLLASLVHPGACNDLAPGDYHSAKPGDTLPESPIAGGGASVGFRG